MHEIHMYGAHESGSLVPSPHALFVLASRLDIAPLGAFAAHLSELRRLTVTLRGVSPHVWAVAAYWRPPPRCEPLRVGGKSNRPDFAQIGRPGSTRFPA